MSHPAPFDDVRHGSLLRTAATPELPFDLDYRGLRIAALNRVPLQKRDDGYANIPLAGHVTLAGSDAGATAPLAYVQIVAATRVGRPCVGNLDVRRSNEVLPPDPSASETYYFNVDLAETLDLPPTPAIYFVYAFLGPYVSNVVRIEVVDPEASS